MEAALFFILLGKLQEDFRIGTAHISLMAALITLNEIQQNNNTVYVKGGELRLHSKISSKSAYHKCLQDLQSFGYISYEPCLNRYKKSKIDILIG